MQSQVESTLTGVLKRDGSVVPWNVEKIRHAIALAFLRDADGSPRPGADGEATREKIEAVTADVEFALRRLGVANVHIEVIQDAVELALMRKGEHSVARDYVLFRERRAADRSSNGGVARTKPDVRVIGSDGTSSQWDVERLLARIREFAVEGLSEMELRQVAEAAKRDLFDGIHERDMGRALVLAARQFVERNPAFSNLAAALQLGAVRQTAFDLLGLAIDASYEQYFPKYLAHGVAAGLLAPEMLEFDVAQLAKALRPERDAALNFVGTMTLADRYLLVDRVKERTATVFELPQAFWMRVAMGLALNEADRTRRAIEFYELMSQLDYLPSTPTLFNSGTNRPQLSSCYLSTVPDDLDGIFEAIKANALLSKHAGGLGNDWTPVRAMGSLIRGTNGESQGVVPFLRVVNDTAVAVNQGGKRKGAVCAYLETWHLDIEEFLQLRKNTGDERRRTPDMNTANWVPDLFLKRVDRDEPWTLFSPAETADLHDLYGAAFERRYCEYEAAAARGEMAVFRTVSAKELWRQMLSMLFETGHPWITFKDACNVRSPQRHAGVVHSSNLCTEITLNTSGDEIAVCNLGSVNLLRHLTWRDGQASLDLAKLARTVATAMRMLDNVIDINYYSVDKARTANLRHRPVGLGVMGVHDTLQAMGIPYASQAAVDFADYAQEAICLYAYQTSSMLAQERGRYASYVGSSWSHGKLPQDSMDELASERGVAIDVPRTGKLDWEPVRALIAKHGMRNSNCTAIAPTATIANIAGVSAGIDPHLTNLYVKSNMGGEFTVVNPQLVARLRREGLWDEVMVADLKHHDGSLHGIARVPAQLRELFATAMEIDAEWLVKAAARRQKWIDQAQSLNLFMAGASGRKLHELYMLAWRAGLKTTYYLRTGAATRVEKSTGQGGELNAVAPTAATLGGAGSHVKVCAIDNPECEACQ